MLKIWKWNFLAVEVQKLQPKQMDIQTDIQTDPTEINTSPHTWMVKIFFWYTNGHSSCCSVKSLDSENNILIMWIHRTPMYTRESSRVIRMYEKSHKVRSECTVPKYRAAVDYTPSLRASRNLPRCMANSDTCEAVANNYPGSATANSYPGMMST